MPPVPENHLSGIKDGFASTSRLLDCPLSLTQIAGIVNNVNLDKEIVVFNLELDSSQLEYFPLRVDAMMMILVHNGHGTMGLDLAEYKISPGSLIVIQPQNYINLSHIKERTNITVVACSKRIVEDVLPKFSDLLPLILHHRVRPVTHLTKDQVEKLMSFVDFIAYQLQAPDSPMRSKKVICLLQAAFFEVMDIDAQNSNEDLEKVYPRGRKDEILAQFILLVSENFRKERQVTWYAHKMSITPKHLSAVVKELSGRTASEWIETYVVMEAKVLLKTTDKPIQEIARLLNFANQSFFGKYFKYQTGVSPSAFRRS